MITTESVTPFTSLVAQSSLFLDFKTKSALLTDYCSKLARNQHYFTVNRSKATLATTGPKSSNAAHLLHQIMRQVEIDRLERLLVYDSVPFGVSLEGEGATCSSFPLLSC